MKNCGASDSEKWAGTVRIALKELKDCSAVVLNQSVPLLPASVFLTCELGINLTLPVQETKEGIKVH